MKDFQCIPHSFSGLTMRDEMIFISSKRGGENMLRLQIILDLLFVIIGPIGFWLFLCYTVGNNLWLKPPVDHGVPHIHVHRLDMSAHAFFPIVLILSVESRCSIIRPLELLICHMDQLFRYLAIEEENKLYDTTCWSIWPMRL